MRGHESARRQGPGRCVPALTAEPTPPRRTGTPRSIVARPAPRTPVVVEPQPPGAGQTRRSRARRTGRSPQTPKPRAGAPAAQGCSGALPAPQNRGTDSGPRGSAAGRTAARRQRPAPGAGRRTAPPGSRLDPHAGSSEATPAGSAPAPAAGPPFRVGRRRPSAGAQDGGGLRAGATRRSATDRDVVALGASELELEQCAARPAHSRPHSRPEPAHPPAVSARRVGPPARRLRPAPRGLQHAGVDAGPCCMLGKVSARTPRL